jgi:outer membrane protein TolC
VVEFGHLAGLEGRADRLGLVARLPRPHLDQLVNRAIAGNVDLSVLAARIGVAQMRRSAKRAPARCRRWKRAPAPASKRVTGQKFAKQFNLATQVNWDIDIWGKVEKGVQAQKAEFSATEADWRAGYLKLVADVSTTYFQILQFDEQIDPAAAGAGEPGQILPPTRRCSRTACCRRRGCCSSRPKSTG